MSSPVIKSMQTASDRGQLQIQIVSQIQNRPIREQKSVSVIPERRGSR